MAQTSSGFNVLPSASEVYYAPAAETVSDAGWAGGGYVDVPTAPPPPIAPVASARSSRFQELARPLPLWALIGATVVVAGLLIVLQLTGTDWAVGASHVALAAGIIALLIALATAVRSFAGMAASSTPKRIVQFVSAGVGILLLLALCLAGFTQQATIHGWQAHTLEGQQQWQAAINEFQLAGEGTPGSDNIARVYNEWGEQLTTQQQYQQAFTKFDTVLTNYPSATTQVNRAHTSKIKAYLDWAKQASDQRDYTSATARYDQILQLSYCDPGCQSQTSALDATAYYNLAESQLTAQQYSTAIITFQTVLMRFPNSPEATKLHGDYARSLLGEGQQLLTSSCPSAISTYQQLASQFADTPQGQQAAAALKAPVQVKGHFTGVVPSNASLSDIVAMVPGYSNSLTSTQFFAILDNTSTPKAAIHSDGTWTIQSVPLGTYNLAWGTDNNADGARSYLVQRLTTTVGPLCAYDFMDLNYSVPAAP